MRSVHLILTLGVTAVIGFPVKPRDFLDDFGSGGDVFGGLGNSIDDGSSFTASTIDLGDQGSFQVADNSFAGGDLGLTGIESFDLQPPIDLTAAAPDPIPYVDPQPPTVVADVQPTDPGLGAVNGDLLAFAPTSPNTDQISPNSGLSISFANNAPIPEFTPTDGSVIASIENLNPADIASSNSAPVTPDPVPVAANPEPVPIAANPEPVPIAVPNPGTPPAIDDGLSIQGFIANPVNLGADTALTPNLDVINAPIAFTPDDTNIAATLPDLTVPPVQIASADGNIGTGNSAISLQQFKDDVNKYANDPKLTTAERQTLKDYGDVAAKLTPEDFGKLTLDYNFATPGKDANGNTVSVDTVGDLTPRAQTAVRQANFPNAYRTNNGFNFGSIATQGTSTLLNALIRLGTAFGERQILNPQSQIYTVVQKIGVPVSVAVPVTFRVGVAVPTTVLSTLPGGVVTKILVYRPNPPKTTATSILSSATAKPVVSPAKPTITPVPAKPVTRNPAKVKREAQDSANAEPPKEAQGQEHYVSPPPEQSDPEYYVEPEPKEWETTYGKEVVINPVEASGHEKEAEKPQWDKIDSTFQYQAGDYSWEYPHPPPGKSDEAAYPKDEAVAPKEEAAYPNGSGGGSVEEEKPIP